jgi:nitroreductase
MIMADYYELLKTRRSVRDYQDQEVPLDVVREIIRESTLAPSSGNGQPWRYIIVHSRDWIRQLSDESKRNLVAAIEKDPNSPLRKYEATLRDERFNVFYNAPCLVYIVGPAELRSLQVDCALAACYFMFSAAARRLGTCWVAQGSAITDPSTLKALGMPEGYRIVAPIILGYPQSIPPVPPRNDAEILKVVE